ncbi:hypothetical protein MXD63_38555, partial [Frankia sp. Cpl3]|nr:hypothetical protein [Frankia sp. Cpl3]
SIHACRMHQPEKHRLFFSFSVARSERFSGGENDNAGKGFNQNGIRTDVTRNDCGTCCTHNIARECRPVTSTVCGSNTKTPGDE